MNTPTSNLRIIVDSRLKHPYGVTHRMMFFAKQANVKFKAIEVKQAHPHIKTYYL